MEEGFSPIALFIFNFQRAYTLLILRRLEEAKECFIDFFADGQNDYEMACYYLGITPEVQDGKAGWLDDWRKNVKEFLDKFNTQVEKRRSRKAWIEAKTISPKERLKNIKYQPIEFGPDRNMPRSRVKFIKGENTVENFQTFYWSW